MKMRRPLKLIRVIVLLSLFTIMACLFLLVFGRMDETVEIPGVVQPVRRITVKSEISGLVETVAVEEGEEVRAGDTLMTLRAEELSLQADRANRALAEAKARLANLEDEYHHLIASESFETQAALANLFDAQKRTENAREKYERAEDLWRRELISPEERDDAKLTYELYQSNYQALKTRWELLEKRYLLQIEEAREAVTVAQDAYQYAQRQVEKATIVAPISGAILTPHSHELRGAKVSEGEVVLEIGDLSALDFVANLPERDIPHVQVGQEAKIFINAFPHRKYKTFKGRVRKLALQSTPSNLGMVFETRIEIVDPWIAENSTNYRLRPGLSGAAKIVTKYRVRLLESVVGNIKGE